MWKDVTSYSRDDKERVATSFEARDGNLRIVITCGHIHYKPQWIMHCNALSINTQPLRLGISQVEAQEESLRIVHEAINKLAASANELSSQQHSMNLQTNG